MKTFFDKFVIMQICLLLYCFVSPKLTSLKIGHSMKLSVGINT